MDFEKIAQTAEFDQMLTGLSNLAKAIHHLYSNLIASGFDDDHATEIVIAWLTAMVHATQGRN